MAKKIPAINASSMADISFLLLIFFLVTTSMDVNQGLSRRLPAPIPPDQKIKDTKIKDRDIFLVKINWENKLLVEQEPLDVRQLRAKAKEFIANANDASQNGLVNELFKIISSKALQVELSERGYSAFNLAISGIDSEYLKALDLLITSYVVADLNGDGTLEISYAQYTMPSVDNGVMSFDGINLNTVSVNRACPAPAPTSYALKKED